MARPRLLSKPAREAVTVMTTKGIPRIVCAIISPGRVATRFTLAKKKNIPAAVIIKGTIIGEMRIDIIIPLKGICGLLKPRAAIVPRDVAIKVDIKPIYKLIKPMKT